ncbi:MAG: hypothetical protein CSYNP_02600 [Syntrophus sp. SKADARSKE-3]|nr:hypothetical protein [Syntrophus sp. SKADARSKE-3]
MGDERRRRTRVPVHFEVTVQVTDAPIKVETKNLSLNGMFCKPDDRLHKEDEGEARIILSPDVVIVAKAKIIRSDADGLAIAFTDIEQESFFHLKKLVQYNTEDADVIDKELRKAGFETVA